MDIIFLVDFENVIIKEDLFLKLAYNKSNYSTEEIKDLIKAHNGLSPKLREVLLGSMNFGEPDLVKILDEVDIDQGFSAFVEYTKAERYLVYILSQGYDYFVEHILGRVGYDVGHYAHHLHFDEDGTPKTAYPHMGEGDENWKLKVLHKFKSDTRQIVYIGGSASDIRVAEEADVVFAKGKFLDLCRKEGLLALDYEDFGDILIKLKDIIRSM